MHAWRHSFNHLFTRSLLRSFIGRFICYTNYSIIDFSSFFFFKLQGDGEQPNQQGIEDNEQQGGEGGKS